MDKNFSNQLKRLMTENDITQKDLADKLKVTTATTSRWLSGEIMPRLDKILILCELFNIDLYSLLGIKDPYDLTEKEKRIISHYKNDPEFKLIVDRILN
ncbi:MAG: helix-turn-helix domain-containing protein [Anaeroplasmataceae bacterium]|nr:helix-turn-helix domain-containing protein [Anaeroplasmataceae bacterium]